MEKMKDEKCEQVTPVEEMKDEKEEKRVETAEQQPSN